MGIKKYPGKVPCSFSLPLRSLYIPLFSFLMISSSATDFGNRRFEILRSCPQGTGRIRNSGTSCGIGGGGVGERNEKEGQRKRFAERREGMTYSVTRGRGRGGKRVSWLSPLKSISGLSC